MLSTSPQHWWSEIRAAETYRDKFLEDWDDVVEGFHGPGYKPHRTQSDGGDPENHAFEWLSLMIPQITASNPRARVKTDRMGPARFGAQAQTFALNRWVSKAGLEETSEQLATDYGLKYAIGYVAPELLPNQPGDEPERWPVLRRISPRRYLQDPLAIDGKEQRWRGHLVIADKEDLLERAKKNPGAGWNEDAIKTLPESTNLHKYRGGTGNEATSDYHVDRGEVSYWVLWCKEMQPDPKRGPDKGYNGALLFLGVGSGADGEADARWIRDPQPFFGPRWGPYQTSGAYVVPDEAIRLSPIAGTKQQADHLNAVARANERAVVDYKRMALVGHGDPDLELAVVDAEHGSVRGVKVDELNKNLAQVELGGLTTQMLTAEDRARQSLDRNSGTPEAMRGNVEGGATATEVGAAMSGASVRSSHHVDKFRRFQTANLKTVAWYLEFDDTMPAFTLGAEAARQMSDEFGQPVEEVWMRPGLAEGQTYDDFDDYDFEIELYSMERTSEQQDQMQAQELDFLVMQVGPAMLANPHVRWEEYLQKRGELRGTQDYGRLFDVDMARELTAEGMEPMPTAQTPQPRLASDVAGARPVSGGPSGFRSRDNKSTQMVKGLKGAEE